MGKLEDTIGKLRAFRAYLGRVKESNKLVFTRHYSGIRQDFLRRQFPRAWCGRTRVD